VSIIIKICVIYSFRVGSRHDPIIVGLTSTCAISVYHH